MWRIVILLSVALPRLVEAGMYNHPVINLDGKDFKTVMTTEHTAMVAFVAPWCGHCKSLAPEFTAAAQSLAPLIPFYAIDCDASQNKALCAEQRIKGFPTIKAFPRGGKGAARDYRGERKRGALVEHAKGLVPDRVKKLKADKAIDKTLQKFLAENSPLPHGLLVHPSSPSIPLMYKVLAQRLSSKMHFGYIRDTEAHDVLSSLGIEDSGSPTSEPRAVIWRAGTQNRTESLEYNGDLKYNALLEWLQHEIDSPGSTQNPTLTAQSPTSDEPEDAAAKRRAKQQAAMEEAERRDQARREKLAEIQAANPQNDSEVDGDAVEDPTTVQDVPEALPAEGVEDGTSDYTESRGNAAAPEPEAEFVETEEEAVETGLVHEEL